MVVLSRVVVQRFMAVNDILAEYAKSLVSMLEIRRTETSKNTDF